MNNLHTAYAILGLKPGSSREKVVARYKRLSRVWDPAKFSSNDERRDAEEELEKIIDACTFLLDHFESDQHVEHECECAPSADAREDLAEADEDREIARRPKRQGQGLGQRKRLNLEEERDRRFAERLGGRSSKRNIDDESGDESQGKSVSEKTFNFILAAVAAVVLVAGWLSTMGSGTAPNPAQQMLTPQAQQMPEGAAGQAQQMNPLQQMLRSTSEQTPQTSEDQSQPGAQEQSQQSTPEPAPQAAPEQPQQQEAAQE